MGCRVSFTILNPLLVLLLALCTKGCVETERLALLDFKASFKSSSQNQGKLSSWKNSSECCSWEGIGCDNHNKHVVSLDLSFEGLESNKLCHSSLIALNLSHLSSLDSLDLSCSNLSSTVLSLLINSTNNLKELSLFSLNLEVPFPNIFHDVASLERLVISNNQLEDGIFNSIGNLCNLKILDASGCIMKESLANLLQALSPCASHSLEEIDFISMNLTASSLVNLLSGPVAHWLRFKKSLTALFLAYNNLSGTIPSSIGQAESLYVLNLRNNNFSGPLPSLLKNCSQLRILDLGGNHFSGFIPSWMGENLKNLSVLSLGSNSLVGILPTSLCHLGSLQILDLSHNFLLGSIPSCVHDFSAMAHDVNSSLGVYDFEEAVIYDRRRIEDASYYNAYIKWKSKVWKFHSTLHLVKLIDLSSNNLSGEIPTGLASLVELDSIDLSCNSLHGSIPENIGKLKSLQYLNMSSNRLCGQIPQSLSEISSLEMLDLSHNNLSGRIPKGTQLQTFDPSAFAENLDLCGLPLSMCPGDRDDSTAETPPTDESGMEEKWGDKQRFYAGSGAGFACGFFGILSTLIWIREWRYAFFRFASEFGEWILLVLALSKSKISRKLGFKQGNAVLLINCVMLDSPEKR